MDTGLDYHDEGSDDADEKLQLEQRSAIFQEIYDTLIIARGKTLKLAQNAALSTDVHISFEKEEGWGFHIVLQTVDISRSREHELGREDRDFQRHIYVDTETSLKIVKKLSYASRQKFVELILRREAKEFMEYTDPSEDYSDELNQLEEFIDMLLGVKPQDETLWTVPTELEFKNKKKWLPPKPREDLTLKAFGYILQQVRGSFYKTLAKENCEADDEKNKDDEDDKELVNSLRPDSTYLLFDANSQTDDIYPFLRTEADIQREVGDSLLDTHATWTIYPSHFAKVLNGITGDLGTYMRELLAQAAVHIILEQNDNHYPSVDEDKPQRRILHQTMFQEIDDKKLQDFYLRMITGTLPVDELEEMKKQIDGSDMPNEDE